MQNTKSGLPLKKHLEVICLIIGVIVGAGFMTGRELVTFFAAYGYVSLWVLPFLFLIFFFLFNKILLTGSVMEQRMKSRVISVLLFLLNIILACSMFSAIRFLFFNFMPSVTALISFGLLVVASFFICMGGVKKLLTINFILFPFIIVCLVVLLCFGLGMHSDKGFFFDLNLYNLPIFSMLYAMFNLALSSVVISKAGKGLSKRSAMVSSAVASFILCAFIAAGIVVICNNASEILLDDMPFFLLAGKIGLLMQIMLFFSIVFASCITLFATLVTLKSTIQIHIKKSNAVLSFVVCSLTLLLSFIGFGNIIDVFYPVAGVLGTYLILSIIFEKKKGAVAPSKSLVQNLQK